MRLHTIFAIALLLNSLNIFAINDDITLTWGKKGVSMSPTQVDGIEISTQNGYAEIINHDTLTERTFVLQGTCENGGLKYRGKYKVTFELNGLKLENREGSPLDIKCGKRVTVKLKNETENELTDSPDTTHKAVLFCKGHLELTGPGSLTINARGRHGISAKEYILAKQKLGTITIHATGDGCKGIRTGEDYIQHGGNITIHTSGNYLSEDTTSMWGPAFGGGFDFSDILGHIREDFPGIIPDSINAENVDWHAVMDSIFARMPDSLKWGGPGMGDSGFGGPGMMGAGGFQGGMGAPGMGPGGFQGGMGAPEFKGPGMMGPGGMPNDSTRQMMDQGFGGPGMMGFHPFGGNGFGEGGDFEFPDWEEGDSIGGFGGPMGGFMKGRYIGTAKGLKALGNVIVQGGTLTVTTKTPGAEGIEGKKGVELQGGTIYVDAYDDAINSGGKIIFSGADVSATSQRNDCVDSNSREEGAITISAGHLEAFSGAGPPEEGLDCDQSAIVISGGTALSVGSGMGPWPSVPTEKTATQPAILIRETQVRKGQKITLEDTQGKELLSTTSTVNNNMNNSLLTCPELKVGNTYIFKIDGKEAKRITLNSNFSY